MHGPKSFDQEGRIFVYRGPSPDHTKHEKSRALTRKARLWITTVNHWPDQPALQHGSAPQAGSAQQLVQLSPQQLPARRLPRARPRRRGSAQQAGSAAAQAGSAAQQAGSAAPHAGSAAQVGPDSQQLRPRRPRPAAEAESAATKPMTTRRTNRETIEEKRFMENLLGGKPNRIEFRSGVDSVGQGPRQPRPMARTP